MGEGKNARRRDMGVWGWKEGFGGASALSWDLTLAFSWVWCWQRLFACQSRGAREGLVFSEAPIREQACSHGSCLPRA